MRLPGLGLLTFHTPVCVHIRRRKGVISELGKCLSENILCLSENVRGKEFGYGNVYRRVVLSAIIVS